MTFDKDMSWTLFLAISLSPLLIATLVGLALRLRRGAPEPGGGIANFNQRVGSWWVMTGVLALAVMAGKTGVVLLAAFCSLAALREFLTLLRTRCCRGRGGNVGLA